MLTVYARLSGHQNCAEISFPCFFELRQIAAYLTYVIFQMNNVDLDQILYRHPTSDGMKALHLKLLVIERFNKPIVEIAHHFEDGKTFIDIDG